jgi:hypothetical protein
MDATNLPDNSRDDRLSNNNAQSAHDAIDLLVNRMIEGRASASDWLTLRDAVGIDPSLWLQLSGVQGDSSDLAHALARASASAQSITLGAIGASGVQVGDSAGHSDDELAIGVVRRIAPAPKQTHAHTGSRRSIHTMRTAGTWAGWGVAAMLAVALGGTIWRTAMLPSTQGGAGSAALSAGLTGGLATDVNAGSPEGALGEYLKLGKQAGTVVGEMPNRVVLSATPQADGSYDVLYIRQIIERTKATSAFQLKTDDSGQPVLTPATIPTATTTSEPL